MPADPNAVESLFHRARALPPADRDAVLAACDPDVRAKVERLLAADADLDATAGPAADPPTATFGDAYPTATHHTADAGAGAVIGGKYTLGEPIGEGGMGSVWRAKQTEPVKRFVAVKLIKAGMDSRQVLARFEAERQALAMMDHPNIAKVLDGGVHDHRPFFVMELVKGVPITDYCDANTLTPKARLELFVQACQAIQHAHQKGIIHRDIKPSNVLVALYDDRPVVKVIDFGVAKATGGTLTEKTLDTGFGGVVGTPQYMSPEQATFNNLDIDTRSDVYALGVLLYELLTGSPPFSKKELEKKGLIEMLRVVREEEPPRPSTKLSTADALPSLSASRGTEPKKLTGLLRNELDWIVMKALEKVRTRRYETANGFAADVQRYLNGDAVIAHPPSTAYRIRKFVRRNRGQVIAAGLVLTALVAGIAGTTLSLLEARRQEAEAKKQEALARDEAAAKEQARAAEAEQRRTAEHAERQTRKGLAQIEKGVELFAGLLADLDPNHEEKGDPPLFDQLRIRAEKAADELQADAIGAPLAVARLQTILGRSLHQLGNPAKAIGLLESALRTRTNLLGGDHAATRETKAALASAYTNHGRAGDAIRLYQEILDRDGRNPDVSERDRIATRNNLAVAYREAGRQPEAARLFEQVRDGFAALRGPVHADTLTAMNNLSDIYSNMGRSADAICLAERVWEVRRSQLGVEHFKTLSAAMNVSKAYRIGGRGRDAIRVSRELVAAASAKLGADHPFTLGARRELGDACWTAGELAEAVREFESTKQAFTAKLGADHHSTLTASSHLAVAYRSAGRAVDAIRLFEQVRDAQIRTRGDRHPDTLDTQSHLGLAYVAFGQFDAGLRLLEQTRDAMAATHGPKHPRTLNTAAHLAGYYPKAGRLAEALPLAEQVRADALTVLGPDSPGTLNATIVLGSVYLAAKRYDDAIRVFEAARPLSVTHRGPTHLDTLKLLNNLAFCYGNSGRPADALSIYEDTARGVESNGFRVESAVAMISNLCGEYEKLGRYEAAEEWWRKWLAAARPRADANPTDFATGLALFGKFLLLRSKFAEAEPLLRECVAVRERTQPDAWATFNAQSMLGGALLGQGRHADATPHLLAGYEGMKAREKTISPQSRDRIPEALDRLIDLSATTNKPEEAKKWRSERAKYPFVAPRPRAVVK